MTAVAAPQAPDLTAGGTSVTRGLLDVLVAWGIRRIYCCPGSTEAALLDALVTRDDVELVLVTHESVAVAMAEGEARATGLPTVAYVHTNVGMANALAHLSSAQLAHAPVLVLNGLKPTALSGREAFTSVPYPRDMVRQHVKWAHTCVAPESVSEDVDRGLRTASAEPAGPVWLGLPQDVLEGDVPESDARADEVPDGPRGRLSAGARPSRADISRAAALLGAARRPVLVAGGEIARRRASAGVVTLAERLSAPIMEEGRRDFLTSCVPTSHPLHAGFYDPAHPVVRDADVVAFLGCRMFTEFEAGPSAELPPGARLIQLHSDAAEVGRLHRVDAPLAGDAAAALEDLLDALPTGAVPGGPIPGPDGPAPVAPPRFPGHRGLVPVVDAIAAAVARTSATVVLDATTATVPLLRGLRTDRPGQLLCSTSGSLGWGMGAALGVALGDAAHPVVALLGDGSFQFGIPALWTARRSAAPVTFVVLNNGTYSAVASALSRFGGAAAAADRWPGTDIDGLDIAAAARAFGLPAVRAAGADGLADALHRAIGGGGPGLVEVLTGSAPTQAFAHPSAHQDQELA